MLEYQQLKPDIRSLNEADKLATEKINAMTKINKTISYETLQYL